MRPVITVLDVDPGDERLVPLIAALRAELDALYPEEITFDHPTVTGTAHYLLALADGQVAGCCALQPRASGEAELKRMYVVPALRGNGIAGTLMTDVHRVAVERGWSRLTLETGVRQPDAITVYERAGFTPIPNYPPYDQWDLSVCYAKALTPTR